LTVLGTRPDGLGLLEALCALPGVSGQEAAVTAALKQHLCGVAEVEQDRLGNAWAYAGGPDTRGVALIAHADQIGFIVTDVDDSGFVCMERVGEAFGDLLPGRELVVHASSGPVHGVVGRTPRDLVVPEELDKVADVRDQWLDIGARTREEALEVLRIGDPVTFVPRFLRLKNGLLASPALDDRAGLYVVLRAFEEWVGAGGQRGDTGHENRVAVVATAREETGFLGARALARLLACEVAIVVDVIFASDDPGVSSRRAGGRVELGKGPVIARGTASAEHLVQLAERVAQEKHIPCQMRAAAALAGTDADEILTARGCSVLSVSIPLRYMHSAMEVVAEADLETCQGLLVGVIGAWERRRGGA